MTEVNDLMVTEMALNLSHNMTQSGPLPNLSVFSGKENFDIFFET